MEHQLKKTSCRRKAFRWLQWTTATMLLAFIGSCGSPKPADLIQAVQIGNIDSVKRLLAKGADPNATGEESGTALMWAAANGHEGIVEALVNAGADVNLTDQNPNPRLWRVVVGEKPEDKREVMLGHSSPLLQGAAVGNAAIVEFLLKKGAKPDHIDNLGETAL